jgi:hypothetical protein
VVADVHFVDVGEDRSVADDVVGEIVDVVDRRVVTDVAGDDPGTGDSDRKLQVVVLQDKILHCADPDETEERTVHDLSGIEALGNQNVLPVGGGVAVLNEGLDLAARQGSPRPVGVGKLGIPQGVLGSPRGEILRREKIRRD